MHSANCYRHYIIVAVLILGLILGPIMPQIALAAEQGTGAADSTSDEPSTGPGEAAGAGVDVSGSSGKSPSGKGALAPPPKKSPPPEQKTEPKVESEPTPDQVKSVEPKKRPTAIGASAGKVTPTTAETGKEMSLGWKIGAGVLGLGLLLGLAGGGGGGGGGGTTPAHVP